MAIPAHTCNHGHAGFCWEDAAPEQRTALTYLHQHAYNWALTSGLDRGEAERYATHYAGVHYADDPADWTGHAGEYDRWLVIEAAPKATP